MTLEVEIEVTFYLFIIFDMWRPRVHLFSNHIQIFHLRKKKFSNYFCITHKQWLDKKSHR